VVTTGDADIDDDAFVPTCDPVKINYEGTAVTVAQNPLGLDDSVRTSPVSGFFQYLPCLPDSEPDRPERGEYDHPHSGDFLFTIGSVTVTGSGHPMVIVENYDPDTFRFKDGPQLLDENKDLRVMSLNGTRTPDLDLHYSITDGTGAAFSDDKLPKLFPMLNMENYTHTFSLSDDGGTMLMQITSMTQE
jgi:hypothetical protein